MGYRDARKGVTRLLGTTDDRGWKKTCDFTLKRDQDNFDSRSYFRKCQLLSFLEILKAFMNDRIEWGLLKDVISASFLGFIFVDSKTLDRFCLEK